MHCVINPTFAIFSQRKLTYRGPVYMNPNSFEAANLFAGSPVWTGLYITHESGFKKMQFGKRIHWLRVNRRTLH